MMIEYPSSAVMADVFAPEVDFFSIGTNDLTQYVLAMDRLHPQLAKQADGLHPAVLRMIDQTVRAANAAGKWVGACGGVAGDPLGVVILSGLGVHELKRQHPQHRRRQGADPRLVTGEDARPGAARARLPYRRRSRALA